MNKREDEIPPEGYSTTTNLFAALEVATGLVKVGHYKRKRCVEFLDFMDK